MENKEVANHGIDLENFDYENSNPISMLFGFLPGMSQPTGPNVHGVSSGGWGPYSSWMKSKGIDVGPREFLLQGIMDKFRGAIPDNIGGGGSSGGGGDAGDDEAMTTPAESMLQALQYGPTGYTDAMRANLGMDVPNAGFQGGQRPVSEMMKYPSPTGYQPVAPTYDPLAPALERGPKTPATVKDLYIGYNGAAPGGKSEKDNDPSSWFKDLFGGFMGDRSSHGGN